MNKRQTRTLAPSCPMGKCSGMLKLTVTYVASEMVNLSAACVLLLKIIVNIKRIAPLHSVKMVHYFSLQRDACSFRRKVGKVLLP